MIKTVSIDQLMPGHFVTRVIEQEGGLVVKSKGKVKSDTVITSLRQKGVTMLEIDFSKSDVAVQEPTGVEEETEKPKATHINSEASGVALEKANDLYMEAVIMQGSFIDQLQKGAVHDLSSMKQLSEQLIENLFDNPNALTCLTLIKDTDKYLLEHSLNCSILMAMFADYLNYDQETIESLALGAMLMDVGMANVPEELRNSNVSLSSNDWQIIEAHVDYGLDLVEQTEDLPAIAKTVIQQHHERTDGSGYPQGLAGDDIAVFGRMAAIVDTYDAMVSERPHQKALPPAVALKRLARTEGLDKDLVRQFIARIGIHPVGSLVKLKSGKLAIVSKANEQDMLNPTVMSFYSVTGNHYNDVKRIDLSKVDDEIEASVQPSEFNLNLPRFFRDVFVGQAK
jgi:HD-GYP domain-containing protein (c-di-GMP phosphodiesterase class II)